MKHLRLAIGIDIGGTKMAVAAVDEEGAIRARMTLPTQAELGFRLAVERLSGAIEQVRSEASGPGAELVGIGIGCAGPVDPFRGLINNPYTLTGWDGCDIVTPLRERFRIPVYLENDADAALVGECWTGAGRGCDPVVMLTFGTGVGGAAVVGGRIYRGVRGEHAELGHLVVLPDGPACYCGTQGCLESIASGSALAEAGRALGLSEARNVFAAARDGHPAAAAIVERAFNAVRTAAWTLFHTLLPQRLIFGGGIMETEFDRFAGVMKHLDAATQFSRRAVDLARAALRNDAGLVGAARLVFKPEAKVPSPLPTTSSDN